MKKISVWIFLFIFAAFSLAATEDSEVILQAHMAAEADGKDYSAFWWGFWGMYPTALPAMYGLLDAIASGSVQPDFWIVGGLAEVCYLSICFLTGEAKMPASTSAAIRSLYNDEHSISLYETEYKKTLTRIMRRKRGTAALIGLAVALPTFFLISF